MMSGLRCSPFVTTRGGQWICLHVHDVTTGRLGLVGWARSSGALSTRRTRAPLIVGLLRLVRGSAVLRPAVPGGRQRHVRLHSSAAAGGLCRLRGRLPPAGVQALPTRGARAGSRLPPHSLLGAEGMRLQGPAGGSAQTPVGTGGGPGRRQGRGRRIGLRTADAWSSTR